MMARLLLEFTEEELLVIDQARGEVPLLTFCYAAVYDRANLSNPDAYR